MAGLVLSFSAQAGVLKVAALLVGLKSVCCLVLALPLCKVRPCAGTRRCRASQGPVRVCDAAWKGTQITACEAQRCPSSLSFFSAVHRWRGMNGRRKTVLTRCCAGVQACVLRRGCRCPRLARCCPSGPHFRGALARSCI